MSLFFRTFLFCFFVSSVGQAINVTGVYLGSCQRKLGLVLGVNEYSVQFLSLDGSLTRLPRHSIVQYVHYSVERVPFTLGGEIEIAGESVQAYRVFTVKDFEEKILVEGVPHGFTDRKISFFTSDGNELLISKENVSRIERLDGFRVKRSADSRGFQFQHSYAFQRCGQETLRNAHEVFPTQVLTEPLTIRRELDRLEKGYSLIAQYYDEQRFYPKPIIFPEQTSLGVWYNFGSRHGFSKARTNNFAPVLNSTYVSDIYGFQRLITTGSQPNLVFEHEESQTQFFYTFKASYFHFLSYFDPSLILLGTSYKWTSDDFSTGDARISSNGGFGFGFDRGPWQVGFVNSIIGLGAMTADGFYEEELYLTKLHLSHSTYNDRIQILWGAGEKSIYAGGESELRANNLRANYSRFLSDKWKMHLSYIENKVELSDSVKADMVTSISSFSGWATYKYSKRLEFAYQLGLEIQKSSGANQRMFPKLALSTNLIF